MVFRRSVWNVCAALAVMTGRQPVSAPEPAAKVALIGKRQRMGDLGRCDATGEPLTRRSQPQLDQIRMRGKPEAGLESTRETKPVDSAGHWLIESNVVVQMRVQIRARVVRLRASGDPARVAHASRDDG
jgi:hypothetical protein